MTDWVISLVPWWAWLGLAAAVFGVVWRVWGWQGAVVALGGLVAVLSYGRGRTDAYRDERSRQDRRNLDAVKERNRIDDEVGRMDDSAVDDDWDRWLRDHDRSG